LRVVCLPTGPDEYAAALVRALASDTELALLASRAMAERYGADLPSSVGVEGYDWPRHRDPRNLRLIVQLLRRLHELQPDVVHFLGDSVSWLAFVLPLLRRWPLIVTVHDVAYHPGDTMSRRVPMATVRRLRRAADALIVHGASLGTALAATGVAPPAGLHVVDHPALDRHLRLAQRHGLKPEPSDGRRRILFFGRVMAYKGLDVLIQAADRVAAVCPDTLFVIAGAGPELDRLRAELARRPWFELRERYVPDPEVARLFLGTELVVLPYREASQSGVAALAASFGLPVVATDVGELGELVRRTGMGPVVPPGDPDRLAAAIMELLSHPQRRAACAAAARQAATGSLEPGRVAAATLAIYRNALSVRGLECRPAPIAA
jgi:glycosyltransferase involved in cell wall biosynthesis